MSQYKQLPILLLPEQREILDRAAAFNGENVSSFVRRHALDAARKVVKDSDERRGSSEEIFEKAV